MTPGPSHQPSLVRTITLRLAITAMLAIFLQVTIVVARTYFDEEDLNKSYVTREARALLYEVRSGPHGLTFRDRRVPAQYVGEHRAFYAFRILDERGQIIAEHDGRMLAELSPWRPSPSRTQDLWLLDLSQEKKLHVAGGLRQKVGSKDVWVEVATVGDPAGVFRRVLAAEVIDNVWMPMIPLVVLTLGRCRDIGAKVARRPCPGSSAGAAHVASRYGKPFRRFRNAAGGRQLRRCHQWAARPGSQARQCATPVHRQSRPRAQNAALRHHAGAWTDRRSQGAPPGGGRAGNERDGRPSAHARSPGELRSDQGRRVGFGQGRDRPGVSPGGLDPGQPAPDQARGARARPHRRRCVGHSRGLAQSDRERGAPYAARDGH